MSMHEFVTHMSDASSLYSGSSQSHDHIYTIIICSLMIVDDIVLSMIIDNCYSLF